MEYFVQNSTISLSFLLSFFATVIATPISLRFIKKLGIFDNPSTHKHPAIIHTFPVPRGGGIPLFIGIMTASIFFLPITSITISLFFASLFALAIGVLDDKFDISPYIRFGANFLSAALVVGSGVSIAFVTNPLGGILHLNTMQLSLPFGTTATLSDIIALVWIVWVMNMLNWSKGVDGQMPGIVAISALIIGILSLRFTTADLNTIIAARLSFIIAGASLGFLIFNYYPAKIFPGYGATAVYLLLSVVSILSGAKLATAILVMGVPMVDGVITILRRLASGKSPFWHDKKHLHHLLLRLGLTQRHIALFYWFISAILGLISLTLSSKEKLFAIIMVILLIGGGIVFLHAALKKHDKEKGI